MRKELVTVGNPKLPFNRKKLSAEPGSGSCDQLAVMGGRRDIAVSFYTA